MLGQLGRPVRRRCSRWRRNGDGGAGVPLSVGGQVLLVHNRTRPRPYRPQGLAIDPMGPGSPQGMALAATPGTGGEDASGVVACSEVDSVPDGTGQGGASYSIHHDGMMALCPRSTMTSSRPSADCGPPSAPSRSSRSAVTTSATTWQRRRPIGSRQGTTRAVNLAWTAQKESEKTTCNARLPPGTMTWTHEGSRM